VYKEALMAILRSNVMNNVKGFAANMKLRDAIVHELYKETVVIRKFEVTKDDDGNIQTSFKYGTIGMNPVVEAFGLDRDVRINSLPVEYKLEGLDDKYEPRKITVDGERYIFCTSLITVKCEDSEIIDANDANGFIFGDTVYRVLGASPSNEKKAVKYFYKVTDKVADELTAFNIMDEISGHVFSAKFAKLVNGKTITKLNTRWGNYLTTMKCMAEIDLNKDYIAVVFKDNDALVGAYDFNEAVRNQMDAVGIEIDNHINDGAVIHTVPCIQEIGRFVNVELSEADALKVALQMRETVMTAKVMGITMTEEDALAVAKNNNAVFYGNTNGRLMGVYDEDGAKAINVKALEERTEKIKLYVLAMAKASNVRTNGQHLIKYMSVDKDATLDFLRKQFAVKLDDYLVNKLNDETKMQSVNARLIEALGQDAVKNTALMETIINDMMKYAQSAIAKTKVEIDGIYSHMSFDWTYAITGGVVKSLLEVTPEGFVEAYSADVNRKLAKETAAIENNPNLSEEDKAIELFRQRTGVVIKHPSAMPDEYEIVYYMTEKQMKQRITDRLKAVKNNKVKAELKARLTRYVDNAAWGVTTYAPLNAMKNKLAGADVDFDATLTDMSDLKHILIKARLEEQKDKLGYMGKCVFISYKDIDRTELAKDAADDIDL
jgi:hypothetical protein